MTFVISRPLVATYFCIVAKSLNQIVAKSLNQIVAKSLNQIKSQVSAMTRPISTIMTQNVHTVKLTDGLSDVVGSLQKHKIRHLPVVENKEVVGIISRTDINRLTFGSLFENQEEADNTVLAMLTVSHVMTHKPRLIHIEATVREVAEIFTKEEYHALPVVDQKGELAGIVTTTDIIRYLLEQY